MRPPVLHSLLAALALLNAGAVHKLHAQDTPSAKALAEKLGANLIDGASVVRLKIELAPQAGGEKVVLQLQAKARRTAEATDILYQVQWPKERQGEGFVLRKARNQSATGTRFTPPATTAPVKMQDGIFGSALAYEDLADNFFLWDSQELVGEETLGRVPCLILESKPGKGQPSGYTRVRSWIDAKRTVPMRIEKYGPGGAMIRRITTTRLAKDDINRLVPSTFTVQRASMDGETILEGSNSKHDVTLSDADFTVEALQREAP